jgi:hypothetical protein
LEWKPDEEIGGLAAKAFVANEMLGLKAPKTASVSNDPLEDVSPWKTLGPWDMVRSG